MTVSSPETSNLMPGTCCRCPRRAAPGAADASKFIDRAAVNGDYSKKQVRDRSGETNARISDLKAKVEANRKKIKALKARAKL